MSHYKLTYFNVRGLGEPIRMILHYMEQEFEDVRTTFEEWQKMKPKSPFGKLPMLEIDGKILHQSTPICRHLAKQANLRGSNDWEDLQIDIAMDTFQDLRKELSSFHHEQDADLKEKKKKTIMEETIPFYFQRFDKLVKENGGYFANGKLSWVDFYIGAFSDTLISMLGTDVFKPYPNLSAWKTKFFDIPQVKDWVSKRPDSHI